MHYFTRAILRPKAGRNREFQRLSTNGFLAHKLAWSLFGDAADRQRDFVFRWEEGEKAPVLYAVSEREPVDTESIFELATKPYTPRLEAGQKLGFALRVNPIRSSRDENGKQKRHDVVMWAKSKLKESGQWKDGDTTQADLVHQEGLTWLQARAEQNGFAFDPDLLRADGYRKHSFSKRKGGNRVTFCTIDFTGVLVVTRPAVFTQALFTGIGPAKGYGCGMFMVRPM